MRKDHNMVPVNSDFNLYVDIREDNTVLLAMIEEKLDEINDGAEKNPIMSEVKANAVHTRDILDKVRIHPDKGHVN